MKQLIAEERHLRSKRVNWEVIWQDIGDLVNPASNNFTRDVTEGEDKTWHRYDSTAVVANKDRAAHLAGILANPETHWMRIAIKGATEENSPKLSQWLSDASESFMDLLKDPDTRFYEELDKILIDDGSFGCVAMLTQPGRNADVSFRTYSVNNFVFSYDDEGGLDRFFLTIKLTLNQAVAKFGLNNLSVKLQDEYKAQNKSHSEHEFIHAVVPREKRDRSKDDKFNKKIAGYFIEKGSCHQIDEQGYDKIPYEVFMGRQRADESYADSPAIDTIDTIRQLNLEAYYDDYGTEITFKPPFQVPSDGIAGGEQINAYPDGVTVIDPEAAARGEVIRPLFTIGDMRPLQESMQRKQMFIMKAFLVEELEAMRKANMSATEAMINNDRQLRKASPIIRRLFTSLGRVLTRTIKIVMEHDMLQYKLYRNNPDELKRRLILPVFPEDLEDIELKDLKFEFSSPVSRAMKAEENNALMRQFEMFSALVQADPNVRHRYDTDTAFKTFSKNEGVPPKTMRSDEGVQQLIEAEQKQQQQQQQMEAMEQAAGVAEKAGKASQAMSA